MPKSDVEHELSLRRVVKPQRWKFQRRKSTYIKQVNNSSTVHGIARQTICVPRQNSIGLSFFYSGKHNIKNGTTRHFRGLFFN
ncbi:MAG: hypothetical protein HYV42_00865 [Candidatus Magasanikbacteria bacterium]|nr:hypothetical protein [Candidatus Magasanikbacteria bacterium]